MNIPINRGFAPFWLTKEQSDTKPVPARSGDDLIFPALITNEYVEEEDPETKEKKQKLVYKYYRVVIPFMGDNVEDYSGIKLRRWDDLRKFFYGDYVHQSEQNVKGILIAHQLAVKAMFPKEKGAALPEDMVKFNQTYVTFWTLIAAKCQKYSIPYESIPSYFDSTYLMTIAAIYHIPEEEVTEMMAQIQLIVDDLFSNSRRWKELMPKPIEVDLWSLL